MLQFRLDWDGFTDNDICLQLVYISFQYKGKAFKAKSPNILPSIALVIDTLVCTCC